MTDSSSHVLVKGCNCDAAVVHAPMCQVLLESMHDLSFGLVQGSLS